RADQHLLDTIASHTTHSHSYHTNLRLSQVVATIAACDLFIGNDSGLAHIAAAVGTRLVVLWGPVNLSMARPKVPANRCTILYHDLPCRASCPEYKCTNPVHLECLMRTEVDQVIRAVEDLLPSATKRFEVVDQLQARISP